jgi:hypothetical protein
MKITIETDNKHLLTEYIQPTEVANETKATESVANSSNSTSANAVSSDPFSTLLSDAAKELAKQKDATEATSSNDMTLSQIFKQASEAYGVDLEFLKAVARAESNFNPNAKSSAGAMGIMQLMPSTAEALDVKDPYNAYENIMGGAKMLSGLLAKYNGDKSLALAAYNAGSGNVAKYGGIPPFTETQNYVKKVLSYYEEGVTIPADKDISASGQTNYTALASGLQTSLSEFANHESYALFLKEMENEMKVETSDASTAYESLLSAASRALTTTIKEYQ